MHTWLRLRYYFQLIGIFLLLRDKINFLKVFWSVHLNLFYCIIYLLCDFYLWKRLISPFCFQYRSEPTSKYRRLIEQILISSTPEEILQWNGSSSQASMLVRIWKFWHQRSLCTRRSCCSWATKTLISNKNHTSVISSSIEPLRL